MITKGCDSQYAVNPTFAHIWEKLTIDQIADRLKELLPHGQWTHPVTGLPVILSLTGGEPTLHWKQFKDIINHPFISGCKHILVETNCAVPVPTTLIHDIADWLNEDEERHWTWSNSPKLGASGEPWDKAIRPAIAMMQQSLLDQAPADQVEQYFKFVCGPNDDQFDEVAKAMKEYHDAGVS